MSDDDFDPDAFRRDVVARGLDAGTLLVMLGKAFDRCRHRCEQIKPIVPNLECQNICMGILARINALEGHTKELDQQIFGGDGIPRDTPQSVAQQASDNLYDQTFWQYLGRSPDEIEAAYNDAINRPTSLPSRRPVSTALFDLLNGRGYNPPTTPWPPVTPLPHPHPQPDEQPDLGDGPQSMRRAPRIDCRMPIIDYWIAETRDRDTLHFIEDCPSCPSGAQEPEFCNAPVEPRDLAEALGAHCCGTCERMMAANETDGFLFGSVDAKRIFSVWHDRVEHRSEGFLGFGASQTDVPVDEIEGVAFPSPRRVVLQTAAGEINVAFERDAEGALAMEAFRRLGWSFEG